MDDTLAQEVRMPTGLTTDEGDLKEFKNAGVLNLPGSDKHQSGYYIVINGTSFYRWGGENDMGGASYWAYGVRPIIELKPGILIDGTKCEFLGNEAWALNKVN